MCSDQIVSSYISLILNIYVNWHIDIFAQIFREKCSDHFFLFYTLTLGHSGSTLGHRVCCVDVISSPTRRVKTLGTMEASNRRDVADLLFLTGK